MKKANAGSTPQEVMRTLSWRMELVHWLEILLPILFCCVVCLVFRTTESNGYVLLSKFWHLGSFRNFWNEIHLPSWMIYNLPAALWVFSLTLFSSRIGIRKKYQNLVLFLPITFVIGLECCQLIGWTDGTFDQADIGLPIFFFAVATLMIQSESYTYTRFSWRKFCVLLILFFSVYMADVSI